MAEKTVLEIQDITKEFFGVKVLKSINLRVFKGEIHAIVGENGAGKSTLMKIIAGEYRPEGGKVLIDGKEIKQFSPRVAQGEGIALVHQEFNLVPQMTVYENIFLGRWSDRALSLVERKTLMNKAASLLEKLGAHHIPVNTRLSSLSLGDRQIVEIARALSTDPKILILDEPTAALSLEETKMLFNVIRNLRNHGVTCLYISHRLEEIFEIADRITILRDGEIVFTGSVTEITLNEVIGFMVGRGLKNRYPPKPERKTGETVLQVKNLVALPYFKDISFQIKKGEILGITGLLACGNTQVGEVLFGLRKPTAGEIYFEGENITKLLKNPYVAIHHGIFYMPGDRHQLGLVLRRSVKENFSLPNLKDFSSFGVLNKRKEKTVVAAYAEKLNVKFSGLEQRVETLSGGNQQKVVMGKWLIRQHVKLFIFDEPTRGIDVGARYEIYKLIYEISSQGVTVIVISSDMDEVLNVSDRVLVMSEGKITGEVDPSRSSKEEILFLAVKKKEE